MSVKVDRSENKTAELPEDCATPQEEPCELLRCLDCGSDTVRVTSVPTVGFYVCCTKCGNQGTPEKFKARRRTYTVRWEIEVDAYSVLEAAKEAESIQRCQVNRRDDEGGPVKAGVFDVRLFGRAPDQWDEMRVDLDTESVVRRIKL